MKRLLGGIFESTHLIGSSMLFATALLLTALTIPAALDLGGLSIESGARVFDKLMVLMKSYGTWLAGLVLLTGLLAPYIRSDDGKVIAWMRILTAGGAVACVVWLISSSTGTVLPGDVEYSANAASSLTARGDQDLTAWNALAICTGLNLLLAAFQINGHQKED